MIIVKDHEDWEWYVAKDDPGWTAVRTLEKIGFTSQLVLPRPVLLTGELPVEDYQESANEALSTIPLIAQAAPRAAKFLRQRVEDRVRLVFCLRMLRGT